MDPRRGQAQWQQGGGGTFGSSQQQSGQGVQQQGQQQGQQGGQGYSYSYSSSYSSGPGGQYGQADFSQDKGGGGVEHHHVAWGPGQEPQHHHFSTQGQQQEGQQQGGQQEGGEQRMPEDLAALQQARNAVQMDSIRAVQDLHQRAGRQAQHEAPRLLETPMLQGAGGGDGWMDSRMSSRGGGCGVGGSEEEGRRGGERGREVGEKVEIGRKEENEERETEEKEEEKEKKQEAWSSYETVFTNAKAGMEGVDKERVKRIVYAMSQGSRFFQHEQRKEAVLLAKIAHMQRAKQAIPPEKLALLERQADGMLARMVAEEKREGRRRVWVHVDMDAFYAAVEALGDARLRDVPMAVGGMGMLCTANYEARKYGVRAAMPGFIARKLCPELVFVPPDFTKYQHYSNLTHEVFRQYDPHFVARSLDEAYLDITGVCEERGMTPAQVAEELRHKVHAHTGLTCSAGVAANRMLAKVCSDINKPNGQYLLPFDREAILSFISSLPIRKIGGVGKVTERLLRDVLGVTVCADIITHRGALLALFSPISAEFFLQAALGIGGSGDVEEGPRKSISCERTFSPLSAEPAILNKLEELSFALAKDLEEHGMKGRTLTLKLKTTTFEVRTRAVSVPEPIGSQQEMWPLVVRLIRAELPVSVRLLGLRMSALVPRASSGSSRQATISEVLGGRRGGGGGSAKGAAEGKYPTGCPEGKFPTGPTEGKHSAYMGLKRVAPSKGRGGEGRERLLEENLVEGWREAHGGAEEVEERQLGSCFESTQNRERLVEESLVEGGREAHGGAKGVEERRFEAPQNILEGESEVHGGAEGVEERRLGGEGREHARFFNACVQNETGREVGEGELQHQQEQPQQYMPGVGDISEQEEDMACEEKETSCEEKETVREENNEKKLRGDEQRACGGEGTQADDQHEVTWVAVRESGAMRCGMCGHEVAVHEQPWGLQEHADFHLALALTRLDQQEATDAATAGVRVSASRGGWDSWHRFAGSRPLQRIDGGGKGRGGGKGKGRGRGKGTGRKTGQGAAKG
ncbi:unnamed protein product [Closterium sp. Naga37s-1]|nr:unnamed protein product [Closterium sp. Naga37s-1]